jgi:hypothetical protein
MRIYLLCSEPSPGGTNAAEGSHERPGEGEGGGRGFQWEGNGSGGRGAKSPEGGMGGGGQGGDLLIVETIFVSFLFNLDQSSTLQIINS